MVFLVDVETFPHFALTDQLVLDSLLEEIHLRLEGEGVVLSREPLQVVVEVGKVGVLGLLLHEVALAVLLGQKSAQSGLPHSNVS